MSERLTRLCQKTSLCRGGLGFVAEDAALSERTQLCRKGSVCMCRGGCGFCGEDTALSERMCLHMSGWMRLFRKDTALSERMCLHVSVWMRLFWKGYGFVREDTTLSKSRRLCCFWRECYFGGRGSFNVKTYTLQQVILKNKTIYALRTGPVEFIL